MHLYDSYWYFNIAYVWHIFYAIWDTLKSAGVYTPLLTLMWMCHSSLQTKGGMTFLLQKHGFKWGMKKSQWMKKSRWMDINMNTYLIVFSLKVKNLLTVSLKIFEFWIMIKDSNQREWKTRERKEKSRWMEKSRSIKNSAGI